MTDEHPEIDDEPLDIGMPILPNGYCPEGLRPCSEFPDRDEDVLVLHAWIDFDGDVRTGKPVRWIRYVSRWNGGWDEPEWMQEKPGASFWGDDEELADHPSFWQRLPPLPPDLPVVEISDED
jgi:hypothetical protein